MKLAKNQSEVWNHFQVYREAVAGANGGKRGGCGWINKIIMKKNNYNFSTSKY
jgi:hypothetical protein